MYIQNIFFFLILSVFSIYGELFTSIADLQRLLKVESQIPEFINQYIETRKQQLDGLKDMVEHFRYKNSSNLDRITNPVNAFLLIKDLASTWKEVQNKMRESVAEELINDVSGELPSSEDLDGAAIALTRLQDVYRLDTHDLANGIIYGKKVLNNLTAHDCYQIAVSTYNQHDFYHAITWMQEAIDRSKTEPKDQFPMVTALEYLSYSLYKQGNMQRALIATDQLYKIAPNHPHAKASIDWYENAMDNMGMEYADFRKNIPPLSNPRPKSYNNEERTIYEALCRGEVPVSPKESAKLYCYYKRDRPFLRIAPIKVDIVRLNPLAVMFRDVIYDSEIEIIQELARPKLNRATAWDNVKKMYVPVDYRISKSAWLRADNEIIERVNKRTELMTNLDMDTAEDLQIANYGIGGHYDPHYDFSRDTVKTPIEEISGNRIATVLFYLSQPEIGGATVFTEIKTTNYPSKNDALFWYNLYRTGEGDLRTRHAACPVLLGVKWVANKWIHEGAQEFRRKCGLKTFEQERYVGDLGGPEPRYQPNTKWL